jgi:3-oxoacyl-[acyl-carrier protein] reductase
MQEVTILKSNNLLLGKRALITGATGDLGRSIAEVFAENGADLVLCLRSKSTDFDNFCESLTTKFGTNIRVEYLDLADQVSISNLVSKLGGENVQIDVLVNNAGIPFGATTLMTKASDLIRVFQVNYFSQVSLTQGIVKLMVRRKQGVVINVSSVSGIRTDPGTLAYGGSKAALIHSTKVMAAEFAIYGVRVNAIAPEMIETQMLQEMSPSARENAIDRSNFDRPALPVEIAKIGLFLASEMSNHLSGEIISNSGGK